jgi:TonB family protein
MKSFWICAVASGLLISTFTFAQQPASNLPATTSLAFENGAIANGIYSNECFGFSLPVPAGWEVNEAVTAGGKARHRSDKDVVLLFLRQQDKLPGRIILSAFDASGHTGGAQAFVTDAVRAQINSTTDKHELVRDTFAVKFGGRDFFRSDYKGFLSDKTSLYFAYVYTEFRGYFIGETVAAPSPEDLDKAANSLQAISFHPDEINHQCAMSPNAATSSDAAPKTALPQVVRVSVGVATGLLIKKVDPEYPPAALQSRVQGQVVLRALIDKNGDVESLTLFSGDPLLAPAALAAVKQWKYTPYLLNGQPTKIDTVVEVNFSLSRH